MLFNGAEHPFRAPYYENVDYGDSEDRSARQAMTVHAAKVLTHIGKTTARPNRVGLFLSR